MKIDTRLVANNQTIIFSSSSDLVQFHCIRSFLAALRDLKSAIFGLKSGFLARFLLKSKFLLDIPHHLSVTFHFLSFS